MRILMASAEFSPLARTGGLGDAVAGLAAALADLGHEVAVAIPRYADLGAVGEEEPGPVGPAAAVSRSRHDGVTVLAVADPPAFGRPGIYGPSPGLSYDDSWWRWGRFAAAAAALAEGYDVLHLHDAHTGAAALLADTPSVFTVHNPAHPVTGPLDEVAELLDLDPEHIQPYGALEWYGVANYLKAGIVAADRASTVSPTFAAELAGDPAESFGLGDLVRGLAHPMVGILTGIDEDAYDPARDPHLPAPFSPARLAGRARVRKALVKRAGLAAGTIFGNVGRVSAQKGILLLDPVLDELVAEGFRFVAVGNGDLDHVVDRWVREHPGAIAHLPFDDQAARLVFGGADAYLMPSTFEPSGLGQLYAMRYGCPPVVRFTGGLADSVVDVDEHPDRGNGFGFRVALPEELAKTVRRAMRLHAAEPGTWASLQRAGMEADWSWRRRAGEYLELYAAAATG
jgi:starch synthase